MSNALRNLTRIVINDRVMMGSMRTRASCHKMSTSTVDQEEIARFSSSSFNHDFWWVNKEGSPLRSMNQVRIPLVTKSLLKPGLSISTNALPLEQFKILDLGCGGGLISEPLARLGAQVTGLDATPQNIDICNQHMNESSPDLTSRLNYVHSTIEAFCSVQSNVNKYDAIVCSEVLEHIEDIELFLTCSKRVLKDEGKMVITTINQTLAAQVLAISVAENVLRLVPKGTHSYRKLVPVNGLVLLMEEIGFSVQSVQGLAFNPLTGRWSYVPTTAINYALVATKIPDRMMNKEKT